MPKRAPLYYTIGSILYLAAFVANRFVLESSIVGAILLILFLLFFGRQLGAWSVSHLPLWWQMAIGSMLLLSAIGIFGTILYYIAYLPPELWVVFVLLTPVAVWLLHPSHTAPLAEFWRVRPHGLPRAFLLLLTLGIILLATLFLFITQIEIQDAVRSPWERIPGVVLWLFALFALCLSFLCLFGRGRTLTFPLLLGGFFFVLAMAAVVYPIGFGFDSFLHQATEAHIAQFGTIDPKPFYYIGQYVLVLFSSSAFSLPLDLVDRLLLPVLTALFLPAAWYFASGVLAANKRGAFFSLLGIFLLPLSGFVVTTPQGLANLWTLLLILLSLPYLATREGLGIRPLAVIAAMAIAIHPLAGIPAALYILLVAADTRGSRKIFWILAALGSISMPLIFAVNAALTGLPMKFDFSKLLPTRFIETLHLDLIFQSGYDILLDVVYLFSANQFLLFTFCTLFILWTWRHRLPPALRLPAIAAIIMIINFLILSSAVEFSFLINYERSNYAGRFLTLAFFFLTPYLLLFLPHMWERLVPAPAVGRATIGVLFAGLLTSQLYLNYPRRDNYETSHGFNTSTADMTAVQFIHDEAPADYIVLSNQQVAAAAVKQFGFLRYFGDLFYYPIPTGGELYQTFLSMNDRPSRELMLEAMRKAGVYTAYYVVDDYWWQAPRIIETAKTNADEWVAIDGGKVHVFRYNRLDR